LVRALVVYESMYGNTERIAVAITEGVGPEAIAVEVGAAPGVVPPEVDLIVLGGPTHGHGMSQPQSRASGTERADRPVPSTGDGIREWLASVRVDRPVAFATFDTRIKGPKLLWGSAADAAKALSARGLKPVMPAVSSIVGGPTGSPYDRLAPSELERARGLGRRLVGLVPVQPR
jgi:hypothetical protein